MGVDDILNIRAAAVTNLNIFSVYNFVQWMVFREMFIYKFQKGLS